jgi:hypothetical protein
MLISFLGMTAFGQNYYPDNIQVVLDNTKPMEHERNDRLPLIFWPLIDPGQLKPEQAEELVEDLDQRGVALMAKWTKENREESLEQALIIGRAQKKLGKEIFVNAIDLLYSFFNGDEHTAHIDADGNTFWDKGFGRKEDMGCPFAIDFRKDDIRERVEFYLDAYQKEGLKIDLIFVDWEVDGPLEVNNAYRTSMRCRRCIEHLGKDPGFPAFQKRLREMRSYLQYYTLSQPVLSRYPEALVGNYAVYPNDGYRYWYDYFEYYVEGQPAIEDQKAKYRQWYEDFPATGFTFAMPVSYTWARIFNWYNFDNTDYRWFYNMLLVASNAGKSTPRNIPVITWVHWNTIFYPGEPDTTVKQMTEESYQELLWHMLLRNTNTFAMWCDPKENAQEIRLIQEVYSAAQEYGDFLDQGLPVNFDVPSQPGTVISGLILNDEVLVRRTDFTDNKEPVTIMAGTTHVNVPYRPGICQLISLK